VWNPNERHAVCLRYLLSGSFSRKRDFELAAKHVDRLREAYDRLKANPSVTYAGPTVFVRSGASTEALEVGSIEWATIVGDQQKVPCSMHKKPRRSRVVCVLQQFDKRPSVVALRDVLLQTRQIR